MVLAAREWLAGDRPPSAPAAMNPAEIEKMRLLVPRGPCDRVQRQLIAHRPNRRISIAPGTAAREAVELLRYEMRAQWS